MKSKYYFTTYSIRAGCSIALLTGMLTGKLAAQGSVEMSPGISTEITGMIHIETNGHWLNQGNLSPGNSTLLLHGEYMQMLQQDVGTFHHVTINKNGGEVTMMSNINIQGGSVSLINWDVVLNGHLIVFDPFAMLSENAGNTVKGPAGYLSTTRALSSPSGDDVAGLGLAITGDDNFGSTEIRRGHAAQSANDHEGILRYYDVFPEYIAVADASLQLRYDESELNGNTEAQLKLYRSPDGGVNWIEVDGVLHETDNRFDAPVVNSFSRFTLSSYCLETCIATEAKSHPATVYLNAAGLGYLQPEDINDGSKGACGIDSMQVIPEVFTCFDIGTQEVMLIVTDLIGCTKSTVSAVEVVDTIPPMVLCKNITVSVDESCLASITVGDIDDGSSDACGISMGINASSFGCDDLGPNPVMLTVTDPSGNTATCEAIVTVEMEINVQCQDASYSLNEYGVVVINPFDLITGDPEMYEGYSFTVEPDNFSCEELGEHQVTLTSTDPSGEVTVCIVTVTIDGHDADCDSVADQCDVCDGGDDLFDTDGDGLPDCADWDGWAYLIEEWQCANNKVFLCHNGNVICVNVNAVPAHLNHGDFLGPCDDVSCNEPPALQTGFTDKVIIASAPHWTSALPIEHQVFISHDVHDEVLSENHPNPFFPETTLRFYLPEKDRINLVVYDMMGTQISIVAQGAFDSGWHDFIFDGMDLADGVYVYMLRTASHCKTGSMVLAR